MAQQQQTLPADEQPPDDTDPSAERQAELRSIYDKNIAAGNPPYAGAVIRTRGELRWIIGEHGWGADDPLTMRDLPDLRETGLRANLSGMNLGLGNLSHTLIAEANFSGADLSSASLTDAFVVDTNFTGASLIAADLSRSIIVGDFTGADLSAATFSGTGMAGKFMKADFTRARMDATTVFGGYKERGGESVTLDDKTRLLDVSWNGAILALVNWDEVPRLGDEQAIKEATNRKERVQAYREAARSYRGLAKALQAQGLTEPAIRYRRREQQLERRALLRDFKFGQWIFSALLNLISGYGDNPGRALAVYLGVIGSFSAVYYGVTNLSAIGLTSGSKPLEWYEALILSLSSFHGRGFFPQTISLGDPIAIVAAIEAVLGLFVELVFIATFTQRFFAR